jgi:hypothetical protein
MGKIQDDSKKYNKFCFYIYYFKIKVKYYFSLHQIFINILGAEFEKVMSYMRVKYLSNVQK